MDSAVFEVHQLAQFSDSDVKTYVRNWFSHVDGASEDNAEALAEAFVNESAAVPDLRRNPLMLALMCIVYRGQHWIPRNRPDMYEHCAKLLFEKWDSSRQIYVELKASAHVDGAVKQLALWMFTEENSGQGVTETELTREATSFLAPVFPSRAEAEAAAREFIDFCRGRGWVLTDVGTTADGEALFAFTHRTFMEYFAAYELTRQHDGPEKLAKTLVTHVAAAEWEVVAQLAVQISNKHWRDGAARILSTLLADKRYRSAASRRNITSFAMLCLDFTHVPLPLAKQIANAFTEALLRYGTEGNMIHSSRFATVPDLQQVVEDEILAVLTDAITTTSPPRKNVAIEVALDLPRLMTMSEFDPFRPNTADRARWRAHQTTVLTALKNDILTKQDDITWFSAWRNELISLEELLTKGPRADKYPLDILFVGTRYRYLDKGGWGDWGTFIPFQFLQSGIDPPAGFPITAAELEWLGHFLDRLGDPPWVSREAAVSNFRNQDGDLLVDNLAGDNGWTLLRLMLIGIECEDQPLVNLGDSRIYYHVLGAMKLRRGTGRERALPQWVAEAFDSLRPDRRELVWAWLNRKVSFVAASED